MRRGFWQKNPFNPKNNSNYTIADAGLPDTVASHPAQTEHVSALACMDDWTIFSIFYLV